MMGNMQPAPGPPQNMQPGAGPPQNMQPGSGPSPIDRGLSSIHLMPANDFQEPGANHPGGYRQDPRNANNIPLNNNPSPGQMPRDPHGVNQPGIRPDPRLQGMNNPPGARPDPRDPGSNQSGFPPDRRVQEFGNGPSVPGQNPRDPGMNGPQDPRMMAMNPGGLKPDPRMQTMPGNLPPPQDQQATNQPPLGYRMDPRMQNPGGNPQRPALDQQGFNQPPAPAGYRPDPRLQTMGGNGGPPGPDPDQQGHPSFRPDPRLNGVNARPPMMRQESREFGMNPTGFRPESRMADPRMTDPRMTDPRLADPRLADPRMTDPRMADPRLADPRMAGNPSVHPPGPGHDPYAGRGPNDPSMGIRPDPRDQQMQNSYHPGRGPNMHPAPGPGNLGNYGQHPPGGRDGPPQGPGQPSGYMNDYRWSIKHYNYQSERISRDYHSTSCK